LRLCAFARIKKNSFAAADRLQSRGGAKVLPSAGLPAEGRQVDQLIYPRVFSADICVSFFSADSRGKGAQIFNSI
jgi:hypothetical protein